ncbi:unnamed protein product [Musa hybrid cultivar]
MLHLLEFENQSSLLLALLACLLTFVTLLVNYLLLLYRNWTKILRAKMLHL